MTKALQQSESKAFYKSVFVLVLPMALQNLINVAVTSADVIMLGAVGETVLSASSLAGQVQFIMTLIFFGLTSGAAVLTAQYWGKNDTRTIEKIMGIALRFSLIVGILFTVVVFLLPRQTMMIFSSEEPVIEEGIKYLRIVSISYVLNAFTMIYLNIMRSVERVIISTVVYLVSLIVNVIMNGLLIFGLFGLPALGISGAAIGTVIARVVEVIIVLCYSKTNHTVRLRFQDIFVHDKLLFRDFLRYSIPVTINEMMWGLGTSMNSVIIGHMGSAVVAANSVAQVTRQLSTVIAFGIANAAAIMLGKAIGAGKTEEAERNSKRFIKITFIASLGGAIIILIVRPIAMANLNLSEVSTGYLSMMMFVMAYFTIAQAYNTTMVVGIFRSGGDTKFGLFLDVSTMWGCSILLGAIFAFIFHFPVVVVYMMLMSDEIIKIPFTTWRYRKKFWLRNVTR
jgi:putative MATE family efflux protein